MRLFFALLPDAVTRERLSSAAAQLPILGRARVVATENFHLTLAFVGEVPVRKLHLFRNMGAALGLRRCAIALDTLEYWPNSKAIVLVARNNPRELAAPTNSLRTAVAVQVPQRREDIRWRAHATLARKVAQAPVLTAMSPVAWISNAFALMSSKTGGTESVYTVVDSWPILDKS